MRLPQHDIVMYAAPMTHRSPNADIIDRALAEVDIDPHHVRFNDVEQTVTLTYGAMVLLIEELRRA